MRFFKTILALALIACGAPASADSGLEPKSLSANLREFDVNLEAYHMATLNGYNDLSGARPNGLGVGYTTVTASATPALTAGHDGLVLSVSMASVTAFTVGSTNTIGVLPYPAKLFISMFDSGGGNPGMRCDSLSISGYNQFGQPIRESGITVYPLIGYFTTNAFESVTAMSVPAGKCGSGSTSDLLLVAVSPAVALPYRIRSVSQIQSICLYESARDGVVSHNESCIPGANGAGTITSGLVYDSYANTIDMSAAAPQSSSGTLGFWGARARFRIKGRASNY